MHVSAGQQATVLNDVEHWVRTPLMNSRGCYTGSQPVGWLLPPAAPASTAASSASCRRCRREKCHPQVAASAVTHAPPPPPPPHPRRERVHRVPCLLLPVLQAAVHKAAQGQRRQQHGLLQHARHQRRALLDGRQEGRDAVLPHARPERLLRGWVEQRRPRLQAAAPAQTSAAPAGPGAGASPAQTTVQRRLSIQLRTARSAGQGLPAAAAGYSYTTKAECCEQAFLDFGRTDCDFPSPPPRPPQPPRPPSPPKPPRPPTQPPWAPQFPPQRPPTAALCYRPEKTHPVQMCAISSPCNWSGKGGQEVRRQRHHGSWGGRGGGRTGGRCSGGPPQPCCTCSPA
jgi:hypothetical protein